MNLSELRALAEGATPGPWTKFWATNPGEWYINQRGAAGYICTMPFYAHRRTECRGNAAYIAAFNPATVLQILSVLEKAKVALVHEDDQQAWDDFRFSLSALESKT